MHLAETLESVRARVRESTLTLSPAVVRMGEEISFEATITSAARVCQRIAVDYVMHCVRANGQTRPKVFKLRVLDLQPFATVSISRRHSFREISTRKYYAGKHALEIVINGKAITRVEFSLR